MSKEDVYSGVKLPEREVYHSSIPSTEVKNALINLISWGGVRLSRLGTSAIIWPTIAAPDDR
jgi:hypothetical protein